MTEREMLRLILVNQAAILTAMAANVVGAYERQKLQAHAEMVLDLTQKDEEDEKESSNGPI